MRWCIGAAEIWRLSIGAVLPPGGGVGTAAMTRLDKASNQIACWWFA